jgi:hypothetical protein
MGGIRSRISGSPEEKRYTPRRCGLVRRFANTTQTSADLFPDPGNAKSNKTLDLILEISLALNTLDEGSPSLSPTRHFNAFIQENTNEHDRPSRAIDS